MTKEKDAIAGQIGKFAKRTHLNHMTSVICVSRRMHKQSRYGNTRCERSGGTRIRNTHHLNLDHRKESCRVASRVSWINHLTGRKPRSRMRGGYAGTNRCRPRWTSRFPDPKGRESATPFLSWTATVATSGGGFCCRSKSASCARSCYEAAPHRTGKKGMHISIVFFLARAERRSISSMALCLWTRGSCRPRMCSLLGHTYRTRTHDDG